jgi:NAD(P)-dependent dehydrogenase (short-subunit alcohol dehydrogenase family)
MVLKFDFEGVVVIVTGGAGSLGSAYCRAFAARGARVLVNDTDAQAAAALAQQLVSLYPSSAAAHNSYSVESTQGAHHIVQHALALFNRVDVLINNAGNLRDASLTKMTAQQWDSVLAVHLTGAFNLCQAVWPAMARQRFGRILMTSSASGLYGNFGQANYSAAKMGLVGLSATLSKEGASKGIQVNCLAPVAKSRMTEQLLPAELSAELSAERVVPLVLYLSHASCSESGAVFEAGGGWFARVGWVRSQGIRAADMEELVSKLGQLNTFRVQSDSDPSVVAYNTHLGDPSSLTESISRMIPAHL